ncbi:NAD(P)H-dependent oxidoreductase [Geminicoccus roseus]|uniref:NAD(P)H-dependent oxidoreductase n=1 Tax=Geminicoccus roseus TaxID=404900 RepID=UPI00041B3336|nr:NAD(P)H-dependent oxidoreductase [Geminicoccus roseus]
MPRRIAIIQGHPDPEDRHYCHALAKAYAQAAEEAGHAVRTIEIARLSFPLLTSKRAWDDPEVPPDIRESQATIAWAEHLVIVYPLWLGGMPALLKGFLEQVLRPGFAVGTGGRTRLLSGRTARIVVTMGMPALVYRWYFGAHSLRSLERNILRFVGIRPSGESLVGMVEGSEARRRRWLARMERLGRRGR